MRTIASNILFACRWWLAGVLALGIGIAVWAVAYNHQRRASAEQQQIEQTSRAQRRADDINEQKREQENDARAAAEAREAMQRKIAEDARVAAEARLDRFLATRGLANTASKKEVAVLVTSNSNRIDQNVSQQIVQRIGAGGVVSASGSLFTPAFIEDGLFDSMFEGERSELAKLGVAQHVDELVFVRERSEASPSPQFSGVYGAKLELDVRIIDARVGMTTGSFKVDGVGSGTDSGSALAMARERAVEELLARFAETPE